MDLTSQNILKWGSHGGLLAVETIKFKRKFGLAFEDMLGDLLHLINPFFVSNMQPAIAGIMSRAINGEDVDVEAEMQDMQQKAEEWSAAQ